MTSKGNSRANGISERESNNQPDCEDDHGIGHAFTEFPRQSLVVGQPKAALRNEDTAKTRVSALPALPPNSELPLRETSSWRSASAWETRSSPSSLQSRQPQKNTATARRFQLFGPVSPGIIRLDPWLWNLTISYRSLLHEGVLHRARRRPVIATQTGSSPLLN